MECCENYGVHITTEWIMCWRYPKNIFVPMRPSLLLLLSFQPKMDFRRYKKEKRWGFLISSTVISQQLGCPMLFHQITDCARHVVSISTLDWAILRSITIWHVRAVDTLKCRAIALWTVWDVFFTKFPAYCGLVSCILRGKNVIWKRFRRLSRDRRYTYFLKRHFGLGNNYWQFQLRLEH